LASFAMSSIHPTSSIRGGSTPTLKWRSIESNHKADPCSTRSCYQFQTSIFLVVFIPTTSKSGFQFCDAYLFEPGVQSNFHFKVLSTSESSMRGVTIISVLQNEKPRYSNQPELGILGRINVNAICLKVPLQSTFCCRNLSPLPL